VATGAGVSIRGADIDDGGDVVASVARGAGGIEIARVAPGGTVRWQRAIDGVGAGPIAIGDGAAVAAIAPPGDARQIDVDGGGPIAAATIRGEPGAALVGLDAATGVPGWVVTVGATDWAVIAAIDIVPGGDAIAVGSFGGTLRIGARVVSSAGASDGFAVRLDRTGKVRWLIRIGGHGADAWTAVDATDEGVAVAGTITGEADLRGTPVVRDADQILPDVAVAWLDPDGAPKWVATLGGDAEESAAGVAALPGGKLAVAATVREVVVFGGATHVARGPSDVLVAIWSRSGAPVVATTLGGLDYDAARGLAVHHDEIVVAGFFSGSMKAGTRELVARGGDDGFVVRLDASAHVVSAAALSGDGSEDISTVAGAPAGVVIAFTHAAALTAFGRQVAAGATIAVER
jgi:hypothetical protein